jgi:hypothetical protein
MRVACVRCGSWWTMAGVPVLMDGRQAWQMNLCFSSKHAGNVSWWGRNVQSIFISTQLEVLQLQLLSF